jgi:hypothetical protein
MQRTTRPIVFGEPYSVYVRTVRLALEEKAVNYELVPVDVFASGGPPPEHKARHPFGKIPAFEHAGFSPLRGRRHHTVFGRGFSRTSAATGGRTRSRPNEPDHQYPRQLRLSDARVGHLCRAWSPDQQAADQQTSKRSPVPCRRPNSACRHYRN